MGAVATHLAVVAQHRLQARRPAPVGELVAEGRRRGEWLTMVGLEERQDVVRGRHRVERRLKLGQYADLEQLAGGSQRLVRTPAQLRPFAVVADVLVTKDVCVIPTGTNVEHQFKPKPRHSAGLVVLPVNGDLWFEPSHVAHALRHLSRPHALARIVGAHTVGDGERHQATDSLEPVLLSVRLHRLQQHYDMDSL